MATILVIEDDRLLREEITNWLTMEDFQVTAAANGEEGVEAARQHRPDLIISDIMMPGIDGFAVLNELRSDQATASLPIIFLTARAERQAVRLGMGLGADDYITKPFTMQELLSAVRARLHQRAVVDASAHKEMNELRSRLVRSLPHELLTPLSGIIGLAELLRDDAATIAPPRISELATFILAGAHRLQRLAENYLNYAELEIIATNRDRLGKLRRTIVFDARDVISGACQRTAAAAQRLPDLQVELAASPIGMQATDLDKVVEEIVDNAFKFSQAGQPVTIRGTVRDEWYQLSVSDHGRGMTPEQVHRIGAYVQFERAIHEQQGVGLGAVVARRIVELYGGHFEIKSTVGAGTAICIILPLPSPAASMPYTDLNWDTQ